MKRSVRSLLLHPAVLVLGPVVVVVIFLFVMFLLGGQSGTMPFQYVLF